jgi:hypothetical protein
LLSSLAETPGVSSLDEVESALKTDVVDILRACLDALTGMDRDTAYETVMNEPMLLHDSFSLFKREPALFAKVIVDDGGQSVEAKDEQRLRCGETLGYIKTLIVRASARRHFRRKLGGYRTVIEQGEASSGAIDTLLSKFGVKRAPVQHKKKVPGRGDLLYRAMREFLLYDWQARLIPHYVHFSPELVDEIGSAILSIREPSELRALSTLQFRNGQKVPPLFLGGAGRLMQSGTSDTIDSEILWKLWEQMELGRLFETVDVAESRKIIAEVAATSKSALELLMPILGEDIRQFIVFLFVAYAQLGRVDFRNVFTESGATQWMAKTYAERLARMPERPVPELSEMTRLFSQVLASPQKPE